MPFPTIVRHVAQSLWDAAQIQHVSRHGVHMSSADVKRARSRWFKLAERASIAAFAPDQADINVPIIDRQVKLLLVRAERTDGSICYLAALLRRVSAAEQSNDVGSSICSEDTRKLLLALPSNVDFGITNHAFGWGDKSEPPLGPSPSPPAHLGNGDIAFVLSETVPKLMPFPLRTTIVPIHEYVHRLNRRSKMVGRRTP